MRPPGILKFAVLLVALGGAALMFWQWRHDLTIPPATTTARPAPPRGGTGIPTRPPPWNSAVAAPLDATLRALWRAIARGEARPNEAVFTFRDDAALRRFLALAPDAGLTVTGRIDALRALRVRFTEARALQAALGRIGDDALSLGANGLVSLPRPPAREVRAATEQVPFGNDTLAFLGASGDRSAWGRGITIAILDTGVAGDATFGRGRLRTLDLGLGTTPGRGGEDGHGTAVAALAAGAAPDAAGVAPAASLLSIRVTDADATSDLFTLAQGIVAAVDAGARIINVSLGGYATGAVLDIAIAHASEKGVLLIAAGGNDQAAQLAWPAADPRVISVGAVDKAEQQVIFSNSGAQLQLTAPGYGVQTAWLDGQRVVVDGTSASAPLVAGAVAALLTHYPGFTPQQAVDLLVRTANDTGPPGADPAFGHGIINLATALNARDATYVDTAVSSHFYDATAQEMQFVVQNRSGRTINGLSLDIAAGEGASTQPVPSLAAGETYVVKLSVSDTALRQAGTLSVTTRLNNPPGTVDAVPANNRRASVLQAPGKP